MCIPIYCHGINAECSNSMQRYIIIKVQQYLNKNYFCDDNFQGTRRATHKIVKAGNTIK
jgi:hypothetical protein